MTCPSGKRTPAASSVWSLSQHSFRYLARVPCRCRIRDGPPLATSDPRALARSGGSSDGAIHGHQARGFWAGAAKGGHVAVPVRQLGHVLAGQLEPGRLLALPGSGQPTPYLRSVTPCPVAARCSRSTCRSPCRRALPAFPPPGGHERRPARRLLERPGVCHVTDVLWGFPLTVFEDSNVIVPWGFTPAIWARHGTRGVRHNGFMRYSTKLTPRSRAHSDCWR